jgi:anaerobic selenocysteine-containing dehydrogenase
MKKLDISRRDFLKGTAVTGIATVAVIAGKEVVENNSQPAVPAKNADNQNAKPTCLELIAALNSRNS